MISRLIASTLPLFPKRFVWLFSRSYIAGETVEDAMSRLSGAERRQYKNHRRHPG